ncbi:MAG: hypothetical protein R3D45_06300 [Rhizobiaceae bacterium]
MRIFFLILVLIGLVLAIAYPFAAQNLGGYDIGQYEVYSTETGFVPVEMELSDEEDPVRILVDYYTSTRLNAVMASAKLSLTVLRGPEREFTRELEFIHSTPGENSVHSGRTVIRLTGGIINPVGTQRYTFAFSPVGESKLVPDRIQMILKASAIEWNPSVQILGYGIWAIGAAGFIVLLIRGRRGAAQRQRWGRAGGED